jgi:uncharacterized protein with FMN-binding domain
MKKLIVAIIVGCVVGLALFSRNIHPVSIKPNSSASSVASSPTATPTTSTPAQTYKDGTYTGQSADAYYGNVQVQVVISGGKITDVRFLDYPHDAGTSRMINGQAMPLLKQEVITAQSGNVNGVSGASATSQAFYNSLQSALSQAV